MYRINLMLFMPSTYKTIRYVMPINLYVKKHTVHLLLLLKKSH